MPVATTGASFKEATQAMENAAAADLQLPRHEVNVFTDAFRHAWVLGQPSAEATKDAKPALHRPNRSLCPVPRGFPVCVAR